MHSIKKHVSQLLMYFYIVKYFIMKCQGKIATE